MEKDISVLGATGSIGRQTLDVARSLRLCVRALTGNRNVDLMERLAREFSPELVAMAGEDAAKELRERLFGTGIRVETGEQGLLAAARLDAATVVSAIVGAAGIRPTVEAIRRGCRVALANKEVLVAAGSVVMPLAKQCGAEILPVDSEHSAIFQCLLSRGGSAVSRILLTCSGGPFFGKTRTELAHVTRQQALAHPSWSMGPKITIDSATLMNKGLECIEAAWLFDLPINKIEVLIHRQSIVHSMVEFEDRAVIAQLGTPDMRIPIQFALTYPQRLPMQAPALDFSSGMALTFTKPDTEAFGCLALCARAFEMGGTAPAALSAAGEVAVYAFLEQRISFLEIEGLCARLLDVHENRENPTLEQILQADEQARVWATQAVELAAHGAQEREGHREKQGGGK